MSEMRSIDKKLVNALSQINWEPLENQNILITGATGLVGRCLIKVILEHNSVAQTHTRITAVGRNIKKLHDRFSDYLDNPNLELYQHDVQQPWEYDERIDYIFHMASNTHPLQYALDPIATEMTNILGTHYLLQLAAKNQGCRFVFTSSTDIYGDNRSSKEFLEETDCGYIDCNTLRANYIEGKRASEALCNAYKKQHGVDFIIARFCRIFGDTMQMEDSRAISSFIKNAVNGEDIVLKSAGTQVFSYLHVYDVVVALLKIAAVGESGAAYNVATNDRCMSLKELAQMLADIGGSEVVMGSLNKDEREGASTFQNVKLDGTKLSKLGWKAVIELREGLEATVDYFRTQNRIETE